MVNYRQFYRRWHEVLKKTLDQIAFHYRIQEPLPNIQVKHEMESRWGEYNSLNRTIWIGEKTLISASWDEVVETIKHELAHHLTYLQDEIIEKAHGKAFKRQCKRLGISSKASARFKGVLDEDNNEDIVRRIQKLLALGTSANMYEAEGALKKAQKLMQQYQIHGEELIEEVEQYDYKWIGRIKKRRPVEEIMILNLLSEFFFTEYILVPAYDAKCDYEGQIIEIYGFQKNILVGEYLYHYLQRILNELWKRHQRETGKKGKREKKSYQVGLLEGLRIKLSQSHDEKEKNNLLIKEKHQLNIFLKKRHPRVRTINRGGASLHASTFDMGKEDGKKISLHHAITKTMKSFLLR